MYRHTSFNPQRAIVGVVVAILHICLLLFLLQGLVPRASISKSELEVATGGVFAVSAQHPKLPKIELPDPAELIPPPIEISDAPVAPAAADASGSPNVTIPAQAIASSHEFPSMPAAIHFETQASVQLILSVSETGMVSDAQVHRSSRSRALDEFAVSWVKTHWRYRPAMLAGKPVPVKTLAIVIFNSILK